jgi:tetratricopeptide (TPR) repeat protein
MMALFFLGFMFYLYEISVLNSIVILSSLVLVVITISYAYQEKTNNCEYKRIKETCEKEIHDCHNVIRTDPLNSQATFRLGELYEKLDMVDKAIAYYTKACELEPSHQNKYQIEQVLKKLNYSQSPRSVSLVRTLPAWLNILFLISIPVLIFSFSQKDKLPGNDEILEELYRDPVQTPTEQKSFQLTKKNVVYDIKPVFDYDIYGLVVSYHNSNSALAFDLLHEQAKDWVNIRDIGLVWGDNIKSSGYKEGKYESGDFSLSYLGPLDYKYLSNNHILAGNLEMIEKIMKARKGDQIHIKGYLVNYRNKDWGEWWRSSSIVRDDHNTGSECEIIYVTDFEILKEANVGWRYTYKILIFLMIGYIIFWLKVNFEYKE